MKSFVRSAILLAVLASMLPPLVAEIVCYPGIKIYNPDGTFMCWAEYSDNCQYCHDEIIVRG